MSISFPWFLGEAKKTDPGNEVAMVLALKSIRLRDDDNGDPSLAIRT